MNRSFRHSPLNDVTVLLADDSVFIRRLLRAILEPEGCHVVAEADNCRAAQEMYRQFRPTIMLLDDKLPFSSGYEVARAILSEDPDARILLSCLEPPMSEEFSVAGIKGILPIPFKAEQLLGEVRRVTGIPVQAE